jgi:hypothetical protein
MRRLASIAVLSLAAAACSTPAGSPSAAAPTPTSTTPASTSGPGAASMAPSTATGQAPGQVTLEDIGGNAPVSGTAGFTLQGGDVAMTLELGGTDQLLPFPNEVSVWIMPGTCAEQTEPVDVPSAIARGTVDIEGGVATEPVMIPLAAITAAPHSILVTNAPGDLNLACGEIGIG